MTADTARGLIILREQHRALITAEFGRAVGHARHRRFRYRPYISLFSDS